MSDLDRAYRLDHWPLHRGGMGFAFNFSLMSSMEGRQSVTDEARVWCRETFPRNPDQRYTWMGKRQLHIYNDADVLMFQLRWYEDSRTLGNLR